MYLYMYIYCVYSRLDVKRELAVIFFFIKDCGLSTVGNCMTTWKKTILLKYNTCFDILKINIDKIRKPRFQSGLRKWLVSYVSINFIKVVHLKLRHKKKNWLPSFWKTVRFTMSSFPFWLYLKRTWHTGLRYSIWLFLMKNLFKMG